MSTMTISLTELRPRLPEIIGKISRSFDRCIITRRGKPEAVVLSEDDYESLIETLDILSDKKLIKGIRKAQEELIAGKGIPWKEANAKLGYV